MSTYAGPWGGFDPTDLFNDDWAEQYEKVLTGNGFRTLTQRKVSEFLEPFQVREKSGMSAEQFCRDILGHDPWEVPLEIMEALSKPSASVAVKACHASSKTYSAAEIALYFVVELGAKVITTAPTDGQVKRLLWGELRRFHHQAKQDLGGYLLEKELRYTEENFAVGLSTNEAERFQGFHGDLVLIIADEAPGVRETIYEAIEGIRAGGDVRLLLIGNPTINGGTFEDAFTKNRKFWKTVTIDGYDTPNLRDLNLHDEANLEAFMALDPQDPADAEILDYAPRPYLITRRWVHLRLHQWGPDDPRFKSRVRGMFPDYDEWSLYRLGWMEKAGYAECSKVELPDQPAALQIKPTDDIEAGLDIAGAGEDETCLVIREGPLIHEVLAWTHEDTQPQVLKACRKYEMVARAKGKRFVLKYDRSGLGAFYIPEIKDAGITCVPVHAQDKPHNEVDYETFKDESYFLLREMLEKEKIAGLKDEELISQGISIRGLTSRRGKNIVEPKEDRKKRGLRSPDRWEALVLAFCKPNKMRRPKRKKRYVGGPIRG